ncbi:multidrug efflux MFS transporter, partial [Streptomyces sp. CJ_13]|uniref:MFS transporter n=1 Tax=Streptomyces sp. CJ_13 TaxID=2724943 RepID=UPI001BDD9EC7
MAGGLGTTVTTVQWVSTGYLLTVAFAAPLSGRLHKSYGGKRVWLGSVALFVAASALCGPAWSGPSLIAFRLLQGIGGGLMQPVGQALAADRTGGPGRTGRRRKGGGARADAAPERPGRTGLRARAVGDGRVGPV